MKKNKNRIKYFILFSLIISIFLIFNCSNISNNYQSVDGGVRSNNKLYNVSPSTVYFNSLEDMTVGVQTKDQMKNWLDYTLCQRD